MRPTVNAVERDLRRLLKGDVEFDPIARHLYATDASIYQIEPLGVVCPRDEEDVVLLVRYATEHEVPLIPRGAGSGLAGAAIGAGVVVDFTRYMNRILEFAPDGSWARVQPGVIMGELNLHARRFGKFFAPNPSSENYCSIGGMIGCNSSGSRSVAYGGTKDHVISLNVVLSGGELFRASTVQADSPALHNLLQSSQVSGKAFSTLVNELRANTSAIHASLPRVMKNSSGYRVETVVDSEAGLVHLHKIFIGAEGTLGLVTEAVLNLVPLPGRRAIAMAYFPSVFSAGEAVFPILELKPTSLEIMDSGFLQFVRQNNAAIDALLPQNADTALLVEFEASDDAALADRLQALRDLLLPDSAIEVRPALDPDEQKRLWAVRQSAVPLLQKLPGPRRITEFIEDVTVHPDVLAQYMSTLSEILGRHGSTAIMYGHAGDGNIHTRPMLDLKRREDLELMQKIMDEVMDFVFEIKGTPSGEHGDGLIRTPYVPRLYGEQVYEVFKNIKRAFDPINIFNPGKKILGKAEAGGVGHHLRYGPDYWTYDQPTLLLFPDGEYQQQIEKCHGCGQCKSAVGTSMCPTYKATRKEHASPRAKANLLRNIIQGKLHPYETYGEEAFKAVIDYCIECGMCAVECPSNVNIPKLMLEAKSKYRSLGQARPVERALGNADLLFTAGHLVAPVANAVLKRETIRSIGERVVGIDRRRRLPPFAKQTFEQRLRQRKAPTPARRQPDGTVALFYEMYVNYNDPELGFILEQLLMAHGLDVVFPPQKSSGILEMAYGLPAKARETARFNVDSALPYVREGVVVVSGEPTASFAFRQHYFDYLDDPAVEEVARATRDLGEFLVSWRSSHPDNSPAPESISIRVAYHMPCHLKAQQVSATFLDLVAEVPGVEIEEVAAGCCGMAGTFGTKAGTFDLSMQAGRPVFERVKTLSPQLVLSDCSSCRMQIEEATGVPAMHPAEFLAHVYGIRQARKVL